MIRELKNKFVQLRMFVTLLLLAGGVTAAAVQDFNPENPPEPQVLHKVTVDCNLANVAYLSGEGKYTVGTTVWINTSASATSYKFLGWLKNGEAFDQTETSFYHTMGEEDVIYTALYEYSPESPGEPDVIDKHRLHLTCTPNNACSFNRTSGEKVESGENVWLTAYANQSFDFLGWYNGEEKIADSLSMSYTMPSEEVSLVAKFVYNPVSPDDPDSSQDDVDQNRSADVNGDGTVDISDATAVIAVYLQGNLGSPLPAEYVAYDVNNDGTVDISDATHVISVYLAK